MTMELLPKYMLPDEIAKKMICSYCNAYLSHGPIKMQKGSYICGRCDIKGKDEGVLPHIVEIFMANFTFPCKYYKDGCKKTILFNDPQKHESKCAFRIIVCSEFSCSNEILIMHMYDHFQKHHKNLIIKNSQFELDLNELGKKNLLMYESDCVVVIKYVYHSPTKNLQLSIAPVNEKVRNVGKYKLQICNKKDIHNNINLSQKLCHLYNSKILETEEFDNINLSDYLSILNDPKVVIIKISLIYSNDISVTTETLITDKTGEIAQLDDVEEENASKKLQVLRGNNYNGYPTNSNTVVPCKWKNCTKTDTKLQILEHQEECEFRLYVCPLLEDCKEGLHKFNSFFFNHLESYGQYCPDPNKIVIFLYNPNILYRQEKVYNYFIILKRDVVQITCTISASGDWKLVCSSFINIKVNVYFSHKHCRLIFKEPEIANTRYVEYPKSKKFFSECFIDYPRLNAVLKIESCQYNRLY